jgi:hypothetical protein
MIGIDSENEAFTQAQKVRQNLQKNTFFIKTTNENTKENYKSIIAN